MTEQIPHFASLHSESPLFRSRRFPSLVGIARSNPEISEDSRWAKRFLLRPAENNRFCKQIVYFSSLLGCTLVFPF
jgi:hypothetical protein